MKKTEKDAIRAAAGRRRTSTRPTVAQLETASGLSPTARAWLRAIVRDEIRRAISAPVASRQAPVDLSPEVDDLARRLDDVMRRLRHLEDHIEEDTRFALTKAKVIALLKKHGIE
jgi:hypothetical protein